MGIRERLLPSLTPGSLGDGFSTKLTSHPIVLLGILIVVRFRGISYITNLGEGQGRRHPISRNGWSFLVFLAVAQFIPQSVRRGSGVQAFKCASDSRESMRRRSRCSDGRGDLRQKVQRIAEFRRCASPANGRCKRISPILSLSNVWEGLVQFELFNNGHLTSLESSHIVALT